MGHSLCLPQRANRKGPPRVDVNSTDPGSTVRSERGKSLRTETAVAVGDASVAFDQWQLFHHAPLPCSIECMHLRRLRVMYFRSCRSTEIRFDETLTVLAGENNAGKTNAIDALRLVTAPSDARRTRSVGADDVRLGADGLRIEVEFARLDPPQCGIFLSALKSNGDTSASWQYAWAPPTGAARRRSPVWTRTRGASPRPR